MCISENRNQETNKVPFLLNVVYCFFNNYTIMILLECQFFILWASVTTLTASSFICAWQYFLLATRDFDLGINIIKLFLLLSFLFSIIWLQPIVILMTPYINRFTLISFNICEQCFCFLGMSHFYFLCFSIFNTEREKTKEYSFFNQN